MNAFFRNLENCYHETLLALQCDAALILQTDCATPNEVAFDTEKAFKITTRCWLYGTFLNSPYSWQCSVNYTASNVW